MAKRTRGTGGLFKYKNSAMWYAKIYKAGRGFQISTRTSVKEEAKNFLKNLVAKMDAGEPFLGDVKKITYGDLRKALIANYGEKGNKSLQVTASGEEHIFGLTPLDKFFGYESAEKPGVSFTLITTDRARDFIAKRRDDGVSNSTINGSLRLLRRMLNLSREELRLGHVPKIPLLKENAARKGFLAPADFDKLLAAIPLDLKPLVLFLYYCGVRKGEALSIDWKQVDLDRAVVHLEDEQTKSGEARTVPLPNVLLDLLRAVEPKEGKVFNVSDYRIRQEWDKAAEVAGLGGLLVHDMRRSAIRNLIRAGVSQTVAMRISGHRTDSIFRRYNVTSEEDVVEAMRRVEAAKPKLLKV
jgi:integrase